MRDDVQNTTTIGAAILVFQAFDRLFNFSKLSSTFEEAQNRYTSLANDILAEIAKPPRERRDGTNFLHDIIVEKRRIDEKFSHVPLFIERLYNRSRTKNTSERDHVQKKESDHSLELKHAAAKVIQRAWFRYLLRKTNSKRSQAATKIISSHRIKDFENVVDIVDATQLESIVIETPNPPPLVETNKNFKYQRDRFRKNIAHADDGLATDDQILTTLCTTR
jgi:hypothetical protein